MEAGETSYAADEVVWIVEEATTDGDLAEDCLDDPKYLSIAAYPDRNEFRTCFTLWSYDDNDRFFVGETEVGITEFEQSLTEVTALNELEISIYSSRRSGLSVFRLD